ncbi:MAG: hypothetical protein JWP88_1824 [Flaviaesturariibacter sp.]|nr:hypothetical protein [Flaviaesturariibacter sp.]
MSATQHNRYNMQCNVFECVKKFNPLWTGNPHIEETVAYIGPRMERLATLFNDRENSSTAGLTEQKNTILDGICDRAYKLSKKLTVYARKTGNIPLLHEVDRPLYYFDEGLELDRIAHCANMVKLATAHASDLGTYMVTVADVAALGADIEALRPLHGQRDEVAAEGVQLTGSLKQTLAEVQTKLLELDDEMEAFIDDETFLETYAIARRINDRRARGKAEEKKDAVKG